ncbi:MAG: hypothetical protein AAFU85_19225, partial [Planctomycetota bacterium]
MSPEEFDELLNQVDPGGAREVSRERETWSQLVSRRQRRRHNVVLFATAAVILLALGIAWMVTSDGDGARIAEGLPPAEADRSEQEIRAQSGPDPSAADADNRMANEFGMAKPTETEDVKPASPREAFAVYVAEADSEDDLWSDAVNEIRTAEVTRQRELINLVPQVKDPALRETAMDLVCEAAGASSREVLRQWLRPTSTRRVAWERLIEDATFDQCTALVDFARRESERDLLCRRLVSTRHPKALDALTRLALSPQWRSAMRRGIPRLEPDQVHALMMRMRSRDRNVQITSAFILASLPGDTVERVASSMILGGRYRHPAYLVLLSRATPQSVAFLQSASARQDLSPALVSARHHFSTFEGHL